MNIKKATTDNLKKQQKEIAEELKRRSKVKDDVLNLKLKDVKPLVKDVKKLMKGKTLKVKVRPEVPITVTICLTDMADINFIVHDNNESEMWDIVNKAVSENDEVSAYLDEYNSKLSAIDGDLEELQNKYHVDECDIFDAVCTEAAKGLRFVPGYGVR